MTTERKAFSQIFLVPLSTHWPQINGDHFNLSPYFYMLGTTSLYESNSSRPLRTSETNHFWWGFLARSSRRRPEGRNLTFSVLLDIRPCSYRSHRLTSVDGCDEDDGHLFFHDTIHQRYNHLRWSLWFLRFFSRFRRRRNWFQFQWTLRFSRWLSAHTSAIGYDIQFTCRGVLAGRVSGNHTVLTHIFWAKIFDLQQHLFRAIVISSEQAVWSNQWLIVFQPHKLSSENHTCTCYWESLRVLTSGVGLPMIFAVSRAGTPSFRLASSSGMITFGGSIFCKSSLVGGGALTSSGANFSGATNGRVSIAGVGRMVSLHDVSSLPTGFVARTV